MIELADGHARGHLRHGTQRVRCLSLCVRACVLHCTSTAAEDDEMMQVRSFRGLLLEFET